MWWGGFSEPWVTVPNVVISECLNPHVVGRFFRVRTNARTEAVHTS